MSSHYSIEHHKHRLAAWAASRAASTSPLCRFKVEKGIWILESSGFDGKFSSLSSLPHPEDLNECHRNWRNQIIKSAQNHEYHFTHGVAAKLINCYLKVRFVCGGHHDDFRVKALHPPIDAVLLKALASENFGDHATEWRKFKKARWSKFDSNTYEAVISLIQDSLPKGQPLWQIEEHWKGHQ
ncbi:hypothetical protein N9055_00960 [Akkermansiaceae bacterium]|nr:hypothetical protein [Akkermansiaceae bacterium]